ncbi:unnamed protein product [Cylindrotheca closterium]|uniref:Myb-like domain-containing protein n=1 Tax=Cylindrotheca closterium TaxID=2856 RepID=A0AAD2GC71_9STRA|nr:unnamed protein product [Cylindrotheca closterium]
MNDAAFILGDSVEQDVPPALRGLEPSKARRMMEISKELQPILHGKQDKKSAALPPIAPTFTQDNSDQNGPTKVKIGNKMISSDKPARKWTWTSFASSSRPDGALFNHWVRAEVEYTDYPYAKFDVHMNQVVYTDDEYAKYLKSDEWTKSETDYLMELAGKYELRWAVIHDHWFDYYNSADVDDTFITRSVDDLQKRYYSVAATLSQARISQIAAEESQRLSAIVPDQSAPDAKERTEAVLLQTAAAKSLAAAHPKNQPLINSIGTGTSNKMFDADYERERRLHLDRMWNRSKEEEVEEIRLRKELKQIEAKLRKIKKMGGHITGAARSAGVVAPSRMSSAASSRNASRSQSPVPGAAVADSPALLGQSFASTAPMPMPQNPYLQSGRLIPPATGGATGINKTLLTKMDQTLKELKVSAKPVPTRRVCDLYDTVRKHILTLITLKKQLMQKEGSLQAKRVRLAKLRGGDSQTPDEEALLGIVAQPSPAPAAAATSKGSKSKGGKSKAPASKSKAGAQSKAGGQKGAQTKGKPDEAGKAETQGGAKKGKSGGKRKRKVDNKAQTAVASAVAVPGAALAAAAAAAAAMKVTPTAAAAKTAKAVAAKTVPDVASEAKPAAAKKRARKS